MTEESSSFHRPVGFNPQSRQMKLLAIVSPIPQRARGGIRLGDSKGKGKGRAASSLRERSQSLSYLEGPGQPRSPAWYHHSSVAGRSVESVEHDTYPSSSGSVNPPEQVGSPMLPRIEPRQDRNDAGPSHPPSRLAAVNEIEPTTRRTRNPHPHDDPPSRSTGKRKLSETFDTLDPTEHVLDFRNPPPPQGREPLRGFPRQRISKAEPSYSRQGTPDYLVHQHAQSHRSHVPKGSSPRSPLNRDRNVEIGSSRPRSFSEAGSSSSAVAGPSHRYRPPTLSEGRSRRRSPLGEGTMGDISSETQPTMIRFSALSQNPQPAVLGLDTEIPSGIHATAVEGSATEDAPGGLAAEGDQYYYYDNSRNSEEQVGIDHPQDLNFSALASSSSDTLQTRLQTNPIRFREPLTAGSRQDRRVVKGGITVIQVKWDSDRKRRQGYFAPDAGSEKSRFRHYSKDDCCFDE